MIKTKSVYSPIEPSKDSLRILVTRIRGRGLPKSRYHAWMANLGPSETLLCDRQQEWISWIEFVRRYRAELQEGGSIDRRNRIIKNHGQKFTLRRFKFMLDEARSHRCVTVRKGRLIATAIF